MRLVTVVIALATLAGCAGFGPDETPAQEEDTMRLTSPAFDEEASIPDRFTCEGDDASPPLQVDGVPDEARSLALIVDDPDAGSTPWVHWVIWNLPAQEDEIPEGYPPSGDGEAFDEARQGTNSFSSDNQRYRGPCPPPGDGEHRYRFTVFALERTLGLEEGAQRKALEDALEGNVIEQDRLTGVYERS